MIGLLFILFLNFNCYNQKSIAESIAESIGQSMAYFLSSVIGIGIDYTFQKYC